MIAAVVTDLDGQLHGWGHVARATIRSPNCRLA
jgi:hypothetical protein